MVDYQTYKHNWKALWVVLITFLAVYLPHKSSFCNTNDCISVVYEPTVCINEEVKFLLKTLGTCTITDIRWDFGNSASTKEFVGAEPDLLKFTKAGIQEIVIYYYNHEIKESISRIITVEVIEAISEVEINPANPCIGQSIELIAAGPIVGFYVWKGGNLKENKSGDSVYKISDVLTKSVQTYTLEWYVGKGEGDGGCSYRKIPITVEANAVESIQFEQGNTMQVCEGESVKIDITNPQNILYNWNCTENSLQKAGPSIEFTPTESCEIKVTALDNGCLKSGTFKILLQKIPQIEIYPKSSVICVGSSVQLEVVGSIEGETYIWSDNVLFPQNTYANIVMVQPESTDIYEATWHAGNCKVTATAQIEVSNITDILDNRTINICHGEEVKLQVARPNDGTVEWYGGDLPEAIEGEEITVKPNKTTMYSVIWKNSICSDTGTVTVNVNPIPEIELLSSVNNRVCRGELVEITAQTSDTSLNHNFIWHQTANQQNIANHFNNLSFTAEESHTIIAEWVDFDNRCNNKITQSMYLEVIDKPESIKLELESNVNEFCVGDTVDFKITGANDASKYILLDYDNNVTIDSEMLIDGFSLVPQKTTTYVAWWVDDCSTTSNTLTIKVNPIPYITTIDTGDEICPNQSFQIKVLPDNYTEYKWTGGNIKPSSLVTGSTLSREADNATHIYHLKVTDKGCNLDTMVKVNLIDISADITTDQPFNEICDGDAIKLNVTGADFYEWQPAILLDNHITDNPIAKPIDELTQFIVTAYKNGCELQDSIEISIKSSDDCEIDLNNLFVPNAITPNGDGKNDIWQIPELDGNINYRITIFNATGAIVYEAQPYQNEFNGINGGEVPAGTYYYVINRKDSLAQRTGTLTIIR